MDQKEIYEQAARDCMTYAHSKFVVDEAEKKRIYSRELDTRECLIQHGHDIPESPSLQAYLDGYDASLWMAWSYVDLSRFSEQQFKQLNEECPQPQWTAGSPEFAGQ